MRTLAPLACSLAILVAVTTSAIASADPPAPAITDRSDLLPEGIPADLGDRVRRFLARPDAPLPTVRLAEPAVLAEALVNDRLAVRRAALRPGDPEPTLTDAERAALVTASDKTVALYTHSGREILLRPAALDAMVTAGYVPRALRGRMLALAIAHEYARAIQDGEIARLGAEGAGLTSFLAGFDPREPRREVAPPASARTLREAVSEGQATLALQAIADEYGRRDQGWNSAKLIADALSPAALPSDGSPAANRRAIVYRGGVLWMRDAFGRGGIEETWRAFDAPPLELLAGDVDAPNYDPAESDRLVRAMGSARMLLGEGWSGRPQAAKPTATLAPQLALLEPIDRARLLAACRGIASIAAVDPRGGRAAILVLRSTPGDAEIIDRQVLFMNERAIRGAGVREPKRSARSGEDFAVEFLRGEVGSGAESVPVVFLRARRGDVIVQGSIMRTPPDDDALTAIVARILELAQ